MEFIIIIFFFLLICTMIKRLSYSDKKLLDISRSIELSMPMPLGFPIKFIHNREEFEDVWNIIVDSVYYYDRARDVIRVNQWSLYTVKYYTEYVLTYGNFIEKNVLKNFVNLLVINRLI